MRWSRVTWTIVWALPLILIVILSTPVSAWEKVATGTVERVIDGDTFDVSPVGRVRLADINAPEIGQSGAQEATEYLAFLVFDQLVYLDMDDVHGTDVYGRTVAMVYVQYNATHLINVNQALLDAGLAVVDDFPNEFDPATWTLYVFSPTEAIPQIFDVSASLLLSAAVAVAVIVGLALIYALQRRRKNRRS